jgi:hypothetical protein
MDGKRFGIGLAAGLLLGLAIITLSGGLGSAPVVFGPLNPSQAGAAVTATKSMTTTVTVTPTLSGSISSSTAKSANPANSTAGSVSNLPSSASTTGTTTSSPGQSDLTAQGSKEKSPSYSSRIVSITQQPFLSNAVILVPVILAFLLGAVLYRTSMRSKTNSDESQP